MDIKKVVHAKSKKMKRNVKKMEKMYKQNWKCFFLAISNLLRKITSKKFTNEKIETEISFLAKKRK